MLGCTHPAKFVSRRFCVAVLRTMPDVSFAQIYILPELADILKAYTKEVIRRQPEDLLQFSAMYVPRRSSETLQHLASLDSSQFVRSVRTPSSCYALVHNNLVPHIVLVVLPNGNQAVGLKLGIQPGGLHTAMLLCPY